MGEVTLTVPAEHADDFRMALVKEMAWDVEMIESEREAVAEQRTWDTDDERLAARTEDSRNLLRQLQHDAKLVGQVDLAGSGACYLRVSDASDLAHICEAMAHKVVGPKLAEALSVAPMDDGSAAEARELIERVTWAVMRAAELHASWHAEREAVA